MKPKVSLITLGVRDFDTSLAFYSALGFPTHNFVEGQQFVMFQLEGTWLSLFPREQLAADAAVSHDGAGFRGISLAHNVQSPEEVERVYEFALSCGAMGLKAPQQACWGGYSGYFADPDGFLWEVAYNPFTDLT
jgi:catechol 2,3-dioxygenase-like lactoylglutathione lyase family enzyme